MTECLSAAPEFRLGKVVFRAWILDGQRYEWRSPNDRIRAGRKPGCRIEEHRDGSRTIHLDYWATLDGRPIPGRFPNLRSAMLGAINAGSLLWSHAA